MWYERIEGPPPVENTILCQPSTGCFRKTLIFSYVYVLNWIYGLWCFDALKEDLHQKKLLLIQ